MPHHLSEDGVIERNTAIRAAHTPAELRAQAERFGISLSHAYRLRKAVTAGAPATPERFQADMTRGLLFNEMATYGLKRSGGMIDEDYDRTFKPLSKKVKVYREMGDDPIVAAVLQAIKMLIRRVGWYVQPAGSGKADQEAAEFLETCMGDMSHSWMDAIDQSLGMLQYGFAPAELVYKKREGEKPEAGSTYDDGRIGWRKWLYLAPYSLAPGEPWTFTDTGGIESINQLDFYTKPNAVEVKIPIEKALLFRTTAENNNPEGRAILRAMYWPYYIKRNLEEIEAISAERLGAGLPVVYAGQDVAKGTDPNTDFELLKNIVRNVRIDEQMGVAIPFAKMGAGAREGEGVLFELITPSGGKAVDFNQVITRYEQRMAMVGLAQFIHLGMNQVGARALGESSQDFFTLSVSGWADLIEETIHHYATERLMKLNHFPGITAYPRIVHESIVRKSLTEIADYINKLVGTMVITPDPDLEKYLRELAELPEKEEGVEVKAPAQPGAEGETPTSDTQQQVQTVANEVEPTLNLNGAQVQAVMGIVSSVARGDISRDAGLNMLKIMFGMTDSQASRMLGGVEEKIKAGTIAPATQATTPPTPPAAPKPEQPTETPPEKASESFAIRGAGRSGRRPSQIDAVNAYQGELQDTYDKWADDLSYDLAEEDDSDKHPEIIAAALALLLASLIALSRKRLVDAFNRGLGSDGASPELLDDLSKALKDNETYLTASLIPAIGAKLRMGLMDGDIITALRQSNEIGAQAIKSMLDTMKARTGSYSGNWWAIYNHTIGKNAKGKVAWYLDSQAKHCSDCPRFGTVSGTVYDSYDDMLRVTGGKEPASGVECGPHCRCEVRPVTGSATQFSADIFYNPHHDSRGKFAPGGYGGGGSKSVLSDPDEIANQMADGFEREYGFDATHTRDGFIKNKKKELKDNAASPEFSDRANKSIDAAIKDGVIGDDVTYVVLKSGESGYEGGKYDKALKSVTIYESNSIGHAKESLGDAANISSTYDDPIRGTAIHEYGHHYSETLNPKAEMKARVKLEGASPDEKRFIKKSVSYYASTSPIELAAEAYAMKKHPDFDNQPEEVKQFVNSIVD